MWRRSNQEGNLSQTVLLDHFSSFSSVYFRSYVEPTASLQMQKAPLLHLSHSFRPNPAHCDLVASLLKNLSQCVGPSWLLKMAYVAQNGPSINQKQFGANWPDPGSGARTPDPPLSPKRPPHQPALKGDSSPCHLQERGCEAEFLCRLMGLG